MREIKELISRPITTIFLILAICITIFSLDTVIQIIGSNYERQTINDRFYEQHISIKFNDKDFYQFLDTNSAEKYIYNHVEESRPFGNGVSKLNIFGVNNYNNFEKLFETYNEKYFTNEDYTLGKNVAIIGTSLKKFTYIKNGIEHINIDNKDYVVIDYLKDNKNSQWTNAVLVPTNSLSNEFYTDNTINIVKDGSVQDTISNIKNDFKNIELFEHTFDKKNALLNAITFDASVLKDLSLLTALGIINIIIATLFWIKSMYSEILIKIGIGANMVHLFKELLYKLIVINIISLLGSILVSTNLIPLIGKTYFIPINYNIYTTYIVFLLSLLIILIISCISISIIYVKIKKTGVVYYEK